VENGLPLTVGVAHPLNTLGIVKTFVLTCLTASVGSKGKALAVGDKWGLGEIPPVGLGEAQGFPW